MLATRTIQQGAPPLTCPRCGKRLMVNYDELWCLAHGEVGALARRRLVQAAVAPGRASRARAV